MDWSRARWSNFIPFLRRMCAYTASFETFCLPSIFTLTLFIVRCSSGICFAVPKPGITGICWAYIPTPQSENTTPAAIPAAILRSSNARGQKILCLLNIDIVSEGIIFVAGIVSVEK